ncbi:MAG: ATP-binding protein, partial [Kiritimatiellae bacterium]|jgi:signal transduction histidine kinase|nr:ATP-binding protein [Kiritimatiellia bacterium]
LHVNTVTEGLEAVTNREADAFAGSVMQGNFYLSEMRNWDLMISGETDYDNKLHFGVRSDWPLLAGILNKTLDAIPEEDTIAFYRDWVLVDYHQQVNYRILLQILLGAGILLILALLWNRRLANEIQLRKQAEQKVLEGRTRLENSYLELKFLEQQKENLTQMIVHDMRGPLTVMMGALDMAWIYLEPGKENTEECRNLVQTAKAHVKEVSQRVTTLLDVSRLEEGKMPLHPRAGSLLKAAEETVKNHSTLATQQEVSLSVSGEDFSCSFDPDLIHRVYSNLLLNAIKACSKGGRVEVRITTSANRARVEVRDRGCGIEEGDQVKIFEKFSQSGYKAGPARFSASSGVGLAFCKLAILAHGGEIGVESQLGRGSTFWFELPA